MIGESQLGGKILGGEATRDTPAVGIDPTPKRVFYSPKTEVFNKLSEIIGVTIRPTGEVVNNELPLIMFHIPYNKARITLNNEIAVQDIEAVVDTYSTSSVANTRISHQVIAKLMEIDFRIDFSSDIPVMDRAVYRITHRFKLVI